jgi:hypothetical protein
VSGGLRCVWSSPFRNCRRPGPGSLPRSTAGRPRAPVTGDQGPEKGADCLERRSASGSAGPQHHLPSIEARCRDPWPQRLEVLSSGSGIEACRAKGRGGARIVVVEDLSLAGFERSYALQLVGGERSPSGPPPPGHRDRPRLAHSNDTVVPVRLVEVWSRSCCTSPRRGVGRRSCTPPNTGVVAPVPHPAQSDSRFVGKPLVGRGTLVRTGLAASDNTRPRFPCGHLLESLDEVVEDRAKRSGNATARRESDSGQLR